MVIKICVRDYVGDIYHHAKFFSDRFRCFGSAHAWFWLFLGGEVHEKGYRRDATTEFDAKYDAVPRKEVSFGVAKTISKV